MLYHWADDSLPHRKGVQVNLHPKKHHTGETRPRWAKWLSVLYRNYQRVWHIATLQLWLCHACLPQGGVAQNLHAKKTLRHGSATGLWHQGELWDWLKKRCCTITMDFHHMNISWHTHSPCMPFGYDACAAIILVSLVRNVEPILKYWHRGNMMKYVEMVHAIPHDRPWGAPWYKLSVWIFKWWTSQQAPGRFETSPCLDPWDAFWSFPSIPCPQDLQQSVLTALAISFTIMARCIENFSCTMTVGGLWWLLVSLYYRFPISIILPMHQYV